MYIANIITTLRIIGTICLIFTVPFSKTFFVVYSLTGVTDVLDGYVARKTKTESEFGAKLDSVADLLFYLVMMIKILPVIWRKLHTAIWYFVAIVVAIRVSCYLLAAIKYRRFASLHTYMNKLTGFTVFLIPYSYLIDALNGYCFFVSFVSLTAAGEELLIHIKNKEYPTGNKTLLKIGK